MIKDESLVLQKQIGGGLIGDEDIQIAAAQHRADGFDLFLAGGQTNDVAGLLELIQRGGNEPVLNRVWMRFPS